MQSTCRLYNKDQESERECIQDHTAHDVQKRTTARIDRTSSDCQHENRGDAGSTRVHAGHDCFSGSQDESRDDREQEDGKRSVPRPRIGYKREFNRRL